MTQYSNPIQRARALLEMLHWHPGGARSSHPPHAISKGVVGWTASVLSLSGVAAQSLLPQSFIKYTFVVFLVSACMWLLDGVLTRNRPLAWTQVVLVVLNTIAVVRWFA
jgi:hypothetical protein